MYRKSVPILAALIISGGIQTAYAVDLPAYQQQAELSCAICRQQGNLDDELFLICNGHLLVTHTGCMQAWMEMGIVECPQCHQGFSKQNLYLILTGLTGDDVVNQDEPMVEEDLEDELL